MIVLALLATAPLATMAGGDAARFNTCTALIKADPVAAVPQAEAWATTARTVPARQCLGLAYVGAARWTSAATAFEQAAGDAQAQGDGRAAILWSLAGNAAIATDDPARARSDLDRAVQLPGLAIAMRGEAFLDRARADVALKDLAVARTDLDQGMRLVPADPFGWLLSATLARRQNDLVRAEKDIGEALRLASDDASVALEAGNIAAANGVIDAARIAWEKAVELAPKEPAGQAAAAALAANR